MSGGIRVVINGKNHFLPGPTATYEDIVAIAMGLGFTERPPHAITYRHPDPRSGVRPGALNPGSTVKLHDGVVFEALRVPPAGSEGSERGGGRP